MRRVLLVCVLAALFSGPAQARATSDVAYSLGDVYSTTLRFVRLDKGCKIVDKDPDAAFVAFECKEDERVKRGSIEMFRSSIGGRDGVRLQVTLGDDPHYVELRWLELVERKLRDERGTPPELPAKAPPAPAKPPSDGGV